MSKWSWFKKTLFGYRVAFVSTDFEHIVIHRPFRSPLMKSTKLTKKSGLRGAVYEMLVFDEFSPTCPTRKELDKT